MPSSKLLKDFGFEEEIWEESKGAFVPTGFPAPVKKYKLVWEVPNMSIEETYFWVLSHLRDGWGYTNVDKTIDVFAAAENSAFFGVTQQRIGLQQDKVSQFLATIGKMIKELFQLVRELRIIEERLKYYEDSMKGDEAAEIALKGIWIDLVEGGAKNPASVYGMAHQVQFTALPDLFFSTHPRTAAEVDKVVDTERAQFNKVVRNVLKRKLAQYLRWKEATYKELKTRFGFVLKYLKQHYEIIKMYMTWVKPYLRHIRRLTLDEEKVLTPDLISAFEGSMLEVELLAHKFPGGNKKYKSCILVHFLFRTRPAMSYQQEGYQRGPIHVGKVEINIRGYVWTDEQIKKFKEMRKAEDFELMRSVSESVKAAMDALGDELQRYLKKAEESEKEEKEKAEEKPKTVFEKFVNRLLGKKVEEKKEEGKKEVEKEKKKKEIKLKWWQENAEKKAAKNEVLLVAYETYKNFKKAHNMIQW